MHKSDSNNEIQSELYHRVNDIQLEEKDNKEIERKGSDLSIPMRSDTIEGNEDDQKIDKLKTLLWEEDLHQKVKASPDKMSKSEVSHTCNEYFLLYNKVLSINSRS